MALLYESKFRIQPSKQLGIQKKTRAETLGANLDIESSLSCAIRNARVGTFNTNLTHHL